MSALNELIRQLAPSGVPHRPLGAVGELVRGNGLQKSDLTEAGVPAIHYGQVHTHYGIWAAETKSFTTPEKASKLRRAKPGDLVIATTSEDDLAVAKATAWLGDREAAVSGDAYIFRHELDPKFVAYYFTSEQFQSQKRPYVSGTKVRRISGISLAKVNIPVPPIEVQREIVKILDHLAKLEMELVAELEAELEARQVLFGHTRGRLLLEEVDAEIVKLGDIATIGTGSHDTKDAVGGGDYVFYARGRETLRLNSFDFDEQAIITAGDGAGVGKVFHFANGKYALHQRAYRIVPGPKVSARYLYHFFFADFERYLEQISVRGSVTSLRKPMFMNYPIPLPAMDEQERIAGVLDTFEAFINELDAGLRAELAARRKQYEYYRDKLLTFEEAPA